MVNINCKPDKGSKMKIAIIYYTKLGHSKKIAQAIAQEFQVKAHDIRANPELNHVDMLYIVSGIYGGRSAPEMLGYLKSIDRQQVKQALLITSSAGKTTTAADVRAVLADLGVSVADEEFTCQGAILFVGIGHPNRLDIQNTIKFVKRTMQHVKDQGL
jgi:flavodoxin